MLFSRDPLNLTNKHSRKVSCDQMSWFGCFFVLLIISLACWIFEYKGNPSHPSALLLRLQTYN